MLAIQVPRAPLKAFCRRNHIRRLAFFGSVLREDFGPDSDVDVLVEFERGKVPGLAFFTLHEELEKILGRKVDLNTPGCFRSPLREKIQEQAEVFYECPTRPAPKGRNMTAQGNALGPTSNRLESEP